ncbi:retrotransposon protein [Cucumis melo var. makuwa]|uniref:Retrotransposon protein n=1 Tax=Cucumis melo var. makuwa TaxID=1194695 RepID=A0A5A7UI55_CUCMM|nr:retrotransposon protein [Cucumis melo var. makuwa]
MLGERIVSCSLMMTVIESRITLLKKTFQAIIEMRGPTNSGFGWNDDKDRATEACAETFANIASNMPIDNDSVPEDGMDMKFPTMWSPRMNMSPEDMMGGGRDGGTMIKHMEAISSLTMAEMSKCIMLVNQKVSLMRSFIKMSDPMKATYCRILFSGVL